MPLLPDSGPFEFKISLVKLGKYKSPGSDKISAQLIQAGGETLRSEMKKLINSVRNKEELSDSERRLLLYLFTRRAIKLTVVTVVGYH
jgi:hypothetical protein